LIYKKGLPTAPYLDHPAHATCLRFPKTAPVFASEAPPPPPPAGGGSERPRSSPPPHQPYPLLQTATNPPEHTLHKGGGVVRKPNTSTRFRVRKTGNGLVGGEELRALIYKKCTATAPMLVSPVGPRHRWQCSSRAAHGAHATCLHGKTFCGGRVVQITHSMSDPQPSVWCEPQNAHRK
jgi:hypothetical protein